MELTKIMNKSLKLAKNKIAFDINKIHITPLGIMRIKKNLELGTVDVVNWCKKKIKNADHIIRRGKNWYVHNENAIITINAHSYTIITAHKKE
jgi:hypothetical protein